MRLRVRRTRVHVRQGLQVLPHPPCVSMQKEARHGTPSEGEGGRGRIGSGVPRRSGGVSSLGCCGWQPLRFLRGPSEAEARSARGRCESSGLGLTNAQTRSPFVGACASITQFDGRGSPADGFQTQALHYRCLRTFRRALTRWTACWRQDIEASEAQRVLCRLGWLQACRGACVSWICLLSTWPRLCGP